MAIIKLNNELRELEIREQKEIEMVLAALSMELVPYVETILINLKLLTKLDFIFARALWPDIITAPCRNSIRTAISTSRTAAIRCWTPKSGPHQRVSGKGL